MTDFYLDTFTGDLGVNAGGDDLRITTPTEELAQRVYAALEVRRGEWVFDTRLGLPFERFWQRPAVLAEVEAEVERALLAVDGVVAVTVTASSLNRSTRAINITLQVKNTAGTIALNGATVGGQIGLDWTDAGGW